MTTCTCTVFAHSGKTHDLDCPKRQAYERQQRLIITPAKTQSRKAGKRERMDAMMKAMGEQQPMFDGALMNTLLEMVNDKC